MSGDRNGLPPATWIVMLTSGSGVNCPWNVALSASRITGSPVASPPSRIETPSTAGEPADTIAVPDPIMAVYPAVGTTAGIQLPAVNHSPMAPAFHVDVLAAI